MITHNLPDQKDAPQPAKIFSYKGRHRDRLMTVIQGIPFYRSTGKNSKQAGTWFPFLGLLEKTGWIIKPSKKNDLPTDVFDYCKNNKLNKKLKLHRLGNIVTLCISASIGGGLWKKRYGKKLREFLFEHYENQFSNQYSYSQINSSNTKYKSIEGTDQCNLELTTIGVSLLLNNKKSRLPTNNELRLINNAHTPANVKPALIMTLLKENEEMTEKMFHAIVENARFYKRAAEVKPATSEKMTGTLTKREIKPK